MTGTEVILTAINGGGVISWLWFQVKIYSDIQVVKSEIKMIKKKLDL